MSIPFESNTVYRVTRHLLLTVTAVGLLSGCDIQDPSTTGSLVSIDAVAADAPSLDVNVFYATNRQRSTSDDAEEAYTGERGATNFGRCSVAFTPIQLLDTVAPKVPFYIPSETKEVAVVERQASAQFWDSLTEAIASTESQSVVIYVHGYNYGFGRACRMAAEMQRMLAGKATVLMFSWPSNGRPTDYVADLTDVEWSIPELQRLLAGLQERIGAERIQLLAHSLGSRGTIFALQRMAAVLDARPLVGRLIFMAPDFDAQTFAEMLPDLRPLARDITLYASSNDAPLRVSEELNGHPRLGQAGPHLAVLDGMQTIDVSPAGRYQITGHEYFYFQPQVANDVMTLIGTGAGASDRAGLRARTRDGLTYWEIPPE